MTLRDGLAAAGFVGIVALASLGAASEVRGQPSKSPDKQPWTLSEAIEQLSLYPRDVYLQYVALQLSKRDRPTPEQEAQLRQALGRDRRWGGERVESVDLFSMLSGALAVQESLQLDTMRGEQPGGGPRAPIDPRRGGAAGIRPPGNKTPDAAKVRMADLAGPTIKSHPWREMLAGRSPDISPLARCVPADFYFIEFRSLNKLLDLGDTGDLWARHLFSQARQEARSQLSVEHLKRQLAVDTTGLLRPFYDLAVREAAVTGSDLFWREGSDVTLLFRLHQPEVFKAQMDLFLIQAEKTISGAHRSDEEYLGARITHVTSPDREVHVFSAYPAADLHVRSNSRVAIRRVIEAIRGQDERGEKVTRLGDTDEFAYIRTLLPRGAEEEDGLVYLSDPFIRRLVGPQLKLTERRRMLCYNHLRMIGHAALLYRTQTGRTAETLRGLAQAGCSPGEFGAEGLTCPDGGRYTLSPDGIAGVCSHHGRAERLTPCCEIAPAEVSAEEAEAYRAFLDRYNQYWRTFFDPIAIRIQAAPQRYRIETIVLPLIDNSIYTNLASVAGRQPEPLDALPVPNRNIFSVAVRLDKGALVRSLGLESALQDLEPEPEPSPASQDDTAVAALAFKQLALAWHNYHDTYRYFPTAAGLDAEGKKTRLSWRVHLLPFLEEPSLYNEFRLDEPWDSEHNKKLIARMPAIFRPANDKLAAEGKTRFVAPTGEKTIAPIRKKPIAISEVTDGTSNTIMLVETDDEHAVVWTRPDDLELDLTRPLTGLAVHAPGGFLVAMCDGSVAFFRNSIERDRLAALFTRAGGEAVEHRPDDRIALRLPDTRRRSFGLLEQELQQLRVGEFLAKGIGNQVGMHVYDTDPLFAFSLPSFLGMSLGSFTGRRGFLDDEALPIALLVSALNSPVYLSVPVQDPNMVDAFLTRLDGFLARLARQTDPGGMPMFRVDQDYYQLPLGESTARAYGFQVGPVKWRFFWARIGNGLYVASKPFILEDLAAIRTDGAAAGGPRKDAVAHALVRMRPQHWDRVLSSYKLGWAENNREACLQNVGPLSSLARVIASPGKEPPTNARHAALVAAGERYFDSHFFCPDGGRYAWSDDGKGASCTVHGSASAPRQPAAPSPSSDLGRLIGGFSDMVLTLTFLEDGLHAVVEIARK
ncbi:MAG: DUF1559 domain-containing protein [Pirellulales bacterium]|nr:DUF1559 domain-containing protein [Pirellulales bacterium]